jgi:hypothetical protein
VYTYEDYLQLPDEECYHYEILDGMLVREPAPYVCFRHNRNTENGSQNVTGEIED